MKAKLRDKEVCSRCHGTGYAVFKMGGVSYSRPCKKAQPALPLTEAKRNG